MGAEECPFCDNPFEDVDVEHGTVTCCDAGHGLYNDHVPVLEEAAELLRSEDIMDIEKGRELVRKYELRGV